jgi:hypothetical protein
MSGLMYRVTITFLLVLLCGQGYAKTQLDNAELVCTGSKCAMEFTFRKGDALPGFFQRYKPGNPAILTLAFSELSLPVQEGNFKLANNDLVKNISLTTQGTGPKAMTVFSLAVGPNIQNDRNNVSLRGKNVFVVEFSKPVSKKISWSLKKAGKKIDQSGSVATSKAKPQPPSNIKASPAKVEPPKATAVNVATAKAAIPAISAIPANAVAKEAIQAKNEKPATGVVSFGCTQSGGVERFFLHFNGVLSVRTVKTGSKALDIQTDWFDAPVQVNDAKKLGCTTVSGVSFKATQKGMNIHLKSAVQNSTAKVFVFGNRLIVQSQIDHNPAASTLYVAQMAATGSEKVSKAEFVQSFPQDEVGDLAQFYATVKQNQGSLSSSSVFSINERAKPIVVTGEKVAVLSEPVIHADTIAEYSFGKVLMREKIENGVWFVVKTESGKTGYLHTRWASYKGDLTQKQLERIRNVDAVQAKAQSPVAKSSTPVTDTLAQASQVGQGAEEDSSMGILGMLQVRSDQISYNTYGRRDPFVKLSGPSEEGLNIDGVRLVGIIWDAEHPMVLLTDVRNPGVSYTLKENDDIMNGKVLKITPKEVLFSINEFGVSRRYTMVLPDGPGGEK